MKQIFALLLSLALCGRLIATPDPPKDVREQILSLPPGAKLKITTKTGEVLRGRLSAVQAANFTLVTGRTKKSHLIAFADVERITAEPKTHTPVGAWIAFGAVVGVVVIVVSVVLIERHNE